MLNHAFQAAQTKRLQGLRQQKNERDMQDSVLAEQNFLRSIVAGLRAFYLIQVHKIGTREGVLLNLP